MTGGWRLGTDAARWLARRQLRARRTALATLALVVALGATASLVAAGAADRTARAYGHYVDRAEVADVVVNPSLATTEVDRLIRDLPGVRSVTTDALMLATLGDGAPATPAELTARDVGLQVRGSTDGRYLTMDRPALAAGRMPTGTGEVAVTAETAGGQGIEVGDEVQVAFWWRRDDLMAEPDQVVTPVGVERLRVVGIATLPDEALPDELHPRSRMLVSPDIAARYDCLADLPPQDATLEEATEAIAPSGCSSSYRYWSLALGDAASVPATLDALQRGIDALNRRMPQAMTDQDAGYYTYATTTADERARVERSLRPTVTALAVLAAVTALVTVAALALGVARELRRGQDDHRTWWRLGSTHRQVAAAAGAPLVAAVAAGLALALVLAWWLSPVAPAGSVRALSPSPGRELSGWVVIAAAGLGAAGTLVVATLAIGSARRAARHPVRETAVRPPRRLAPRGGPPEVAEGTRAALGGSRGAHLVTAGCGLAVVALLAAIVFGASLSTTLSTPAAYGWPWDLSVMTGAGYGDLDLATAARSLDGRDDVQSWSALGMPSDFSLDGHPVQAVVGSEERAGVDFAVVEGRLPAAVDEVALGRRTASERGVGVGDTVEMTGPAGGRRTLTVTGIAVIPPLGPLLSDRAAPGTGMVLPPSALTPDELDGTLTFVGVDLAPGADPRAVATELGAEIGTWDRSGSPPVTYTDPVRPSELVNVRSMRLVPLVVGGLLAASATVGLAASMVMSVRGRRRDLAILRTLGFTTRQVRAAVGVQVVTTMACALAVGVPFGLAAGRVAWRAFATQLGVATAPSVPGWTVAATIGGALVLALAAAALPASLAARITPAVALRTE